MAESSLEQRAARETILAAGTSVRLRAGASAVLGDQQRVPVGEEGFDLSDTIAVDVRVATSAYPGKWRTILAFDRASIEPSHQMQGAISPQVGGTPVVSIGYDGGTYGATDATTWIEGAAAAVQAAIDAVDPDLGTATSIDMDGDGDIDAVEVVLPWEEDDPWGWDEISADCDVTVWYEPATCSARIWLRSSAVVPPGYASDLQSAYAVGWCLAADIGDVGREGWEQRCAFPARSWGWVELYSVTDPSQYDAAMPANAPRCLAVGVMLTAEAPQ